MLVFSTPVGVDLQCFGMDGVRAMESLRANGRRGMQIGLDDSTPSESSASSRTRETFLLLLLLISRVAAQIAL